MNGEQVRDWRKERRSLLIAQRVAIAREDREPWSERITTAILHQLKINPHR